MGTGSTHSGSWCCGSGPCETSGARLYLALFLVGVVWRVERLHRYGLRTMLRHVESSRLQRSRYPWRTGGYGSDLRGNRHLWYCHIFDRDYWSVASGFGHEIALNCASFTFMVPFAISAAAAVRVGQAIGRNAPSEAASAGWAAILFGAGCMATFSAVLLLFPHAIAGAFTADRAVIAATIPLLFVAALFQFFDGLQDYGYRCAAWRGRHSRRPHCADCWLLDLLGFPSDACLLFGFIMERLACESLACALALSWRVFLSLRSGTGPPAS